MKIKKKPKNEKMHVKKNDLVKVISGHDKGKIGKIIKLLKENSTVIVEGINIKMKHMKPRKEGDIGQIKQFEAPIHSSKVMCYDSESNMASRIAYRIDENNGQKTRFFTKNKKSLD
uniref:ribosomal protein L24 n=1 Tax=Glaucosphaera vacuolata TaxID=38265 RepID=UPI001FCD655F|nr:ribosomal protein L24 [Glaucosphaera vacuolata]UNJ18727.1 ribosomal protein L24 [Glaucosphaera vacuolata]